MTTRVHVAIAIDLPDHDTEQRRLYYQILNESGLGDASPGFEENVVVNGEFDFSEMAAFVLDNRDVSETASSLVTTEEFDTEWWA